MRVLQCARVCGELTGAHDAVVPLRRLCNRRRAEVEAEAVGRMVVSPTSLHTRKQRQSG